MSCMCPHAATFTTLLPTVPHLRYYNYFSILLYMCPPTAIFTTGRHNRNSSIIHVPLYCYIRVLGPHTTMFTTMFTTACHKLTVRITRYMCVLSPHTTCLLQCATTSPSASSHTPATSSRRKGRNTRRRIHHKRAATGTRCDQQKKKKLRASLPPYTPPL